MALSSEAKLSTGVHVGPITIDSLAAKHSKEVRVFTFAQRLVHRRFTGFADTCSACMVRCPNPFILLVCGHEPIPEIGTWIFDMRALPRRIDCAGQSPSQSRGSHSFEKGRCSVVRLPALRFMSSRSVQAVSAGRARQSDGKAETGITVRGKGADSGKAGAYLWRLPHLPLCAVQTFQG
jgi:hypothetical protein